MLRLYTSQCDGQRGRLLKIVHSSMHNRGEIFMQVHTAS